MGAIPASAGALLRFVPSLAAGVAGRLLTCRRGLPEGGAHSGAAGAVLFLDKLQARRPTPAVERTETAKSAVPARSPSTRWSVFERFSYASIR
jgi:hypothetical protein